MGLLWQKRSPPEVELFTAPWVHGTRVVYYMGPVSVDRFIAEPSDHDRDWTEAELELLEDMQWRACVLGCNAVIGVEVTLDPFFIKNGRYGLQLVAVGTAAKLEALL